MIPAERFAQQPLPCDPEIEFTLELGEALHRYGMPAHRVEGAMEAVCRTLGHEARFYSTPTAILASFGPVTDLKTGLLRLPPGELDLEKLVEVDALSNQVIAGARSPEDGSREVKRILAAPSRYGPWSTLLAFFFAAAGAARLFGGGWREVLVAGTASLLIGFLDRLSKTVTPLARVLEPISAMLTAALAALGAAYLGPMSAQVATLAGLIVLLPGLSLTVALTELATRNLTSGTSRLTGAGLVFLQLGFGVALGGRLALVLPAAPPVTLLPPGWLDLVAMAVLALALSVWLRARPSDMGWIALVGAIGYGGARAGEAAFGTELGAFFGALLVGMASNGIARLRDKPAMVTIIPALIVLVPGSIGFRSLEALLARDVLGGVAIAFNTVLAGVALCAGLLFGYALVPPRRVL
jgi:uncharacterized membrane protein YjjP (DUF1212 family)